MLYQYPLWQILVSLFMTAALFSILRLLLQNYIIKKNSLKPKNQRKANPIVHWHWAFFNGVICGFHGLFIQYWEVSWGAVFMAFYMGAWMWGIFDLLWNLRNHGWKGWNYVDDPDPGEDDAVFDTLFHKAPWLQIAVKITLILGFAVLTGLSA